MSDHDKLYGYDNEELSESKKRVLDEIEASEELFGAMPIMPDVSTVNSSNDVITDAATSSSVIDGAGLEEVVRRTGVGLEAAEEQARPQSDSLIENREQLKRSSRFPDIKNRFLGMFKRQKSEAALEKQAERARKKQEKRLNKEKKRAEAFERKRERMLNPEAAKEAAREKRLEKKRRAIEAAEEKRAEKRERAVEAHDAKIEKKRKTAEEKYQREAKARELKMELDRLKHTDKKEYKRVIAENKAKERAEKQSLRRSKKDGAMREKAEKRAAIASLRSRGIKVGSSKGMVAAIIVLSITTGLMTIAAAVFMGSATYFAGGARGGNVKEYYQLVMDMNNLEGALSKVTIATSASGKIAALSEANAYATSAVSSVETLPADENQAEAITSYFNEVSALTESLAAKVAAGKAITGEETKVIEELVSFHESVKETVNSEFEKNSKNVNLYKINVLTRKLAENPLSTTYSAFTEGMATMPKMASASAAKTRTASGKTLSKEEASKLVYEKLSATEVNCDGNCSNTENSLYNFRAMVNGIEYFVQVNANLGKISFLSAYIEGGEATVTNTECVETAKQFAAKMGYGDTVKVWVKADGNVSNVTLATGTDKQSAQSERILVKVEMASGQVIGFEADDYAKSHVDTRSYEAKLSEKQARAKVSDKLQITSSTLCYISLSDEDRLAYEFTGNYDGKTFVSYIDANTGEELKLLRVLSDDSGDTVL